MANPFDQFDAPSAVSSPPSNPFDQFDAKPASQPAVNNPSLLGNGPNDGYVPGALKGAGTAVIKGIANSIGTVGDLGSFADYLLARGDSAITGRPVQDVLADYAKKREATGLAHTIDPTNVLPSGEDVAAPVLKRTGEYKPTTELGRMAQSGLEAATSMIGPGGGAAALERGAVSAGREAGMAALRTAKTLAPANIAAGAIGQGVTDATDDPLLGMAAGMVAPAVGGAAASKIGKTAATVTRPFAEDLPVVGPKFAGQRDQMVGERLRSAAQDPEAFEHALFPGPRQPGGDEIIPGSQPTTGQLTGDMGILQAEREARTADNTDFNLRATEQDAARRAALEGAAPAADTMRPSQFFQDQLAHIERGTDEALQRIQSGAQSLASRMGTGEAPETLGASMRAPLDAAYQAAKKARRDLYDAVDPDGSVTVPAKPLREQVDALHSEIDPYAAPLKADEARLFGRLGSLPDVIPFKSLNALDSDIQAAMTAERRAAGETPTWGRLSRLKNAVMDAINNAVDNKAAYEQAAVSAGALKPQDTIRGRLEGLHGEYGGALGNRPANPGETASDNQARAETGISGFGGAQGEGNAGFRDDAGPQAVSGQVAQARRPQDLNNQQIFYPGGNLLARYELVDLPNLITSHDTNFAVNPRFPQELQPRERGSAPARDQVNNMAAKLQPERLGPSPEANSGAPIVGPDNVVESGNGRTLSIAKAYAKGNPAYRQWLEGQGFDTAGMKQPVLVARRISEMTPDQREFFAHSANSSAGLKMSAAEQAGADARIITPDTLSLITDAPIRSAENRPFVRAFAEKLPAAERGGILDKNGELSQSGVRRLEAALVSRAYDDPNFVARSFDDADSNIRNLAGALADAAGPWARMREAAASGAIDSSHDITHELMSVVRKVMRARDEGQNVADVLKQVDMFGSDVAPLVESLLFRNPETGALASRSRIASGLKSYATEAAKNVAGPRLFDDEIKPRDVLKNAISRAEPDATVAPEPEVPAGPTFAQGAGDAIRPLEANIDEAAIDRLRAAKASHAEMSQTFRNSKIYPVLKKEPRGFKMPDSEVPAKVVIKGDKGYQTAKAFLKAGKNDPALVSAMQDRVIAPLRQTLKPDGTLNGDKLAGWKANYSGALKAIDEVVPGFSSRFDNAAKASDLLLQAAAKREEIVADAQKNAATAFMKASKPSEVEEAIGALLQNKKSGPRQMQDLLSRAKGDSDVIDGLRKAGIDWMSRKFAGTTESGTTGEKAMQKASFDRFVRDNATALSQLYPAEQVNMFRAIARDMDRSSRVLATNVKGSPGTAKDTHAMLEKIAKSAGNNKTLIGAILGAGGSALYHTGSLTTALGAAGIAVPAYLVKTLRAAGINKVEDAFRDALLNPERARFYLQKIPAKTGDDTGPFYGLSRAIRRGIILQPQARPSTH
jgi:hypothetical protein